MTFFRFLGLRLLLGLIGPVLGGDGLRGASEALSPGLVIAKQTKLERKLELLCFTRETFFEESELSVQKQNNHITSASVISKIGICSLLSLKTLSTLIIFCLAGFL